jgi:hypothetical protein
MTENKTQLVSVRVCPSDLEKLGAIARRLRVRESEILRFALRLAFSKLSPMHDNTMHGQDLIPVFLKCGPELMYHFELDPRTLDTIINGEVEDPRKKVTLEDIELLAASHEMPSHRHHSRLNGPPKVLAGRLDLSGALQQYLYDKYVGPKTDMGHPNLCSNAVQIPL